MLSPRSQLQRVIQFHSHTLFLRNQSKRGYHGLGIGGEGWVVAMDGLQNTTRREVWGACTVQCLGCVGET